MIVVLKKDAGDAQINELSGRLSMRGFKVSRIDGEYETVFALVGNTGSISSDELYASGIVNRVIRITEPFVRAGRESHPSDSVYEIGSAKIGGGNFLMIGGPCSVESYDQIVSIAEQVKAGGAGMLRGGAFKPRTSPYDFQGLRGKGLRLLSDAKRACGLPTVSEIADIAHLDLFDDVDVIQVGARNMQNFELLKELGHTDKPVLLKRGLSSTLDEFLMSAEYIMAGGNSRVILCERGIRTFETHTRNTLDLSAVPLLKRLSHLPVIVDPSHAAGDARLVPPLAFAAVASGCDGLMLEVHNDASHAMSDGIQAITPEMFACVCSTAARIREAVKQP